MKAVKTVSTYVPIAGKNVQPVMMNSVPLAINVKSVPMRSTVNYADSAETVSTYVRIAVLFAVTVQTAFARTAVNARDVLMRSVPSAEYV